MPGTDPKAAIIIEPTVGRIVHFRDHRVALACAAVICAVHSDRLVTLRVFGRDGGAYKAEHVPLRQPADLPPGDRFCEWMSYQERKAFGSESGEAAAGRETI